MLAQRFAGVFRAEQSAPLQQRDHLGAEHVELCRQQWGHEVEAVRRTEIEFLNGFVVREGEQAGIQARANERLVDIVKRVERGDLKQDPRHITDLRLN